MSFLVIDDLVEQPGVFGAVSVEVKRLKLLFLDVPIFKVKETVLQFLLLCGKKH